MAADDHSSSPLTIRYRFGMAPDRQLTDDPSLSATVRAMERSDVAVFAVTALIPSLYGYRIESTEMEGFVSLTVGPATQRPCQVSILDLDCALVCLLVPSMPTSAATVCSVYSMMCGQFIALL